MRDREAENSAGEQLAVTMDIGSFADRFVAAVVSAGLKALPLERVFITGIRGCARTRLGKALWWRYRTELCRRTEVGDAGLRWVRLPSGAQLQVRLAELLGGLYLDGAPYEPFTTEFVCRNLHPGDVFVDIGANYGYFSMLAASIVGRGGKVFAFEANPGLQDTIKASSSLNGFDQRVTVTEAALLDVDNKVMDFYLSSDPGQAGISSMFPWDEHLKTGNLSEAKKIAVRTIRFDTWASRTSITRIDMIKLDVEGAELMVLRGMEETLRTRKPRHVICETSVDGEVTQFLSGLGYQVSPLEYHVPEKRWGNMLYVNAAGALGRTAEGASLKTPEADAQ